MFKVNNKDTNFTLVFKRKQYIAKLVSEVGINDGKPSKTYSQSSLTKEEIVNANIINYKKFAIQFNDNGKIFPTGVPKCMKHPLV